MISKMKTGIEGLDMMLYGGLPKGAQVILSGGPGTGKTLLSFEFLYRNAKAGNTSIFFALEEPPLEIVENAKGAFTDFADIDTLIENKKLIIDGGELINKLSVGNTDSQNYEFGKIISEIEAMVAAEGANAIVIDSLSLFDMLIMDPLMFRRSSLALAANLKRLNVTSLLTMEMNTLERSKLEFRPEFFIYDGIIAMYQSGVEDKRVAAIEVIKMRGSNHSSATTPYEITPSGFRIFAAGGIDES
ncbi:MAG: ATPase domain-containing protein [Candidatus Micrarchaeaceae archaeon]